MTDEVFIDLLRDNLDASKKFDCSDDWLIEHRKEIAAFALTLHDREVTLAEQHDHSAVIAEILDWADRQLGIYPDWIDRARQAVGRFTGDAGKPEATTEKRIAAAVAAAYERATALPPAGAMHGYPRSYGICWEYLPPNRTDLSPLEWEPLVTVKAIRALATQPERDALADVIAAAVKKARADDAFALRESRSYALALEEELRTRTAKLERECKLTQALDPLQLLILVPKTTGSAIGNDDETSVLP